MTKIIVLTQASDDQLLREATRPDVVDHVMAEENGTTVKSRAEAQVEESNGSRVAAHR